MSPPPLPEGTPSGAKLASCVAPAPSYAEYKKTEVTPSVPSCSCKQAWCEICFPDPPASATSPVSSAPVEVEKSKNTKEIPTRRAKTTPVKKAKKAKKKKSGANKDLIVSSSSASSSSSVSCEAVVPQKKA